MRSRLFLGAALLAAPLLAACGGTDTAGAGTGTGPSSAPASGAGSVTASATAPGSAASSATAPSTASPSTASAGPVLAGDVYTMTLPKDAVIDASSPAWSRAWSLDLDVGGFGLDGQAMELSCAGCGANTPKTRAKLARQAVRGDGRVLPDVTVNGVTLFHATKGDDGFRTDYYGAFAGGQQLQLVFTSTHPYRETGPIIASTLASLRLTQ